MSDADNARIAKHLGNIDHSIKELVKVFATFNGNFVALIKKMEELDKESDMSSPMSDAEEVHAIVEDVNNLQDRADRETTITTPQPTDG